jgi:hypothetical protein
MKTRLFGTEDYVLHTAEMTRPGKARDPLTARFSEPAFRSAFYGEACGPIARTRIRVVACAMSKAGMAPVLAESGRAPYVYGFEFVLDRMLAGASGPVGLYPERRRPAEDAKLELAVLRAKVAGTRGFRGAAVASRLRRFDFTEKADNESGSQLADLIVSPIGRHAAGKPPKPRGNEIPFAAVLEKIRPGDLAVLP